MEHEGHARVSLSLTWKRWVPPDLELDLHIQLRPRQPWSLARLPESVLRPLARGLTIGWCLLTASLLLPLGAGAAHLFWCVGIPAILLLVLITGHELWRRICPLAVVARLPQHLWPWGIGHGPGQPRRLDPGSWLARHHLVLQGGLLLLGLALRLLLVNTHAPSLALLFALTMAAALVCGALLPGKAWCQYLCPMGLVEAILSGPRGLLGSRPRRTPSGRLSQSTCRTLLPDGGEANACVHCQAPCIDIDSEQTYWQSLRPGDLRSRLTWMYPGLVTVFFALLAQPALPLPAPRLLTVPALLLAGSGASGLLLGLLHRLGLSRHRSRLLATVLAGTVIIVSTDPTMGAAGGGATTLLRLAALLALAIWWRREWRRGLRHHSRDRVLLSLGRQLQHHLPPHLPDSPAGPRHHPALPAVLSWLSVQPPRLQEQLRTPLLRGLINDLRQQPHLDLEALLRDLLSLQRALGQPLADPHELLGRLRRRF